MKISDIVIMVVLLSATSFVLDLIIPFSWSLVVMVVVGGLLGACWGMVMDKRNRKGKGNE